MSLKTIDPREITLELSRLVDRTGSLGTDELARVYRGGSVLGYRVGGDSGVPTRPTCGCSDCLSPAPSSKVRRK